MDISYNHRGYLMIAVVIYLSPGSCSTENRLRFERHPEGVDYDDSYWIKVTRGQEVIRSTLTHVGHHSAITLTVSAFNAVFVLDLQLNKYLFAVDYVERSFNKDGVVYHDLNHTEDHCYYLGKVRDEPQSTAAVSTCKGIVGYFTVGNTSYHIDPASNQLHGPHKVYRSRSDAKTAYRCGNDDVSLGSLLNPTEHNTRMKRFFWPQDFDKKIRIVELYVANDYSQYLAKGNDVYAVTQRTKNIVNFANAGFQPVGIYIVLVGVEVWNTGDKITVKSSDVNSTLKQWADYRMTYINPIHYNDNGVLITNNTFGNFVGFGYIGAMCTNRLSAAFVGDVHPLPSVAGSVMDHEMGHNFGLIHDTETGAPCPCSDPSGKCIMYPTIYSSLTWSQCSKDQFAASFQHGLDLCLYNVPETIQPLNAFCGNGIIEGGEQCDCGNSTEQECNKLCCNSTRCQLISPATCAYGRCCDISTCKTLDAGTVCRQKSGDCDLEEVCHGKTNTCPQDAYKPDGTNCTVEGDDAYCYDGQCRSHKTQCQLLWGPGTEVSNSLCYHQFNGIGKHYGNCGLNWLPNVTFIPCQSSDVMCGKLLCENRGKSLYRYANKFFTSTVSIGAYNCNSVTFDFGLRTQDPGLVPNGAKCEDGKMCVYQKCISVDSLQTRKCDRQCNDNEICNNEGFCQSYKSGASAAVASSSGLTTAMCILFLVVLPLLVIGGILIYRYRHRMEGCLGNAIRSRSQPTVPTVSQSTNPEVVHNNHLQPNSTRMQPSRSAPPPPPSAYRTQLPTLSTAPPAAPFGYDNHGAVPSAAELTPSEQNSRNFALHQTREMPPEPGFSGRPAPPAKPVGLRQVPPVRTSEA